MCSYYRFVFVASAVGNGSYELLNILKLLSNCADFECLKEILCSVSVAIQKLMGLCFLGKFVRTYGVSLIRLYFASQRDIHATDNEPFAKFLASTEIPNLFSSEQNSDCENYSIAATVYM